MVEYIQDDKGNTVSTRQPLYQWLAAAIEAMKRCKANGNAYASKWEAMLEDVEQNLLPSGSGVDNGTKIDYDKSSDEKIALVFSFHHMDENGYYDGWSAYKVGITASFSGIYVKVNGSNRNDVLDYLQQTFQHCLEQTVEASADSVRFYEQKQEV